MAKCAHPASIDVASILIDDPYKAGNCKKCRMSFGRAPMIPGSFELLVVAR